jgi:amino acid transporter
MDNVVSAFPGLAPHEVALSVGAVAVLVAANLRGVKESGRAFAVPTYGFVASILLVVVVGAARGMLGHPVVAASANLHLHAQQSFAGVALLLLLLRAFSSGCTALTGVEAISNGVPSFRPPKSQNAARTLTAMGALAVTMFGGITVLALTSHVHIAENPALLGLAPNAPQQTVIAQLGTATFGGASLLFYLTQAFTAAVLVLAANTAFNGFPVLASILSADGYLPRQFTRRGDRLVFSNGIIVLGLLAVALVVAFDADTTRLIQLYIIGVFVSFTLSQLGMVRHWTRDLAATTDRSARRRIRRSRIVNAVGAGSTALVLVVVLVTKFVHGAWIVTIAMPLLVWMMSAVRRHYRTVARALRPAPGGFPLPARVHLVVPVARLHTAALRALAYARATRPTTLTAVTAEVDPAETAALMREWDERDLPVPLVVLETPYRDITRAVLEYVDERRRDAGPRDVIGVFVPEYIVGHWWEHLLHNQSALRLKTRLLFRPGVFVTSVPAHLRGDALLDTTPAPSRERSEAPQEHPLAQLVRG